MDEDRLDRFAPLSGAGAAVLIAVGVAVSSIEDFLDTPGSLADAYVADAGRILVGCQIGVVGALLLIMFAATLSSVLRRAGDTGRSAAVVLAAGGAAGALWLASFIVHAGGALRADEDDYIDFSSAATVNDLATLLGFAAAPVACAGLVTATAVVALRIDGVLPRWLAFGSLALALALLILPLNWLMTPVFLVWMVAVSLLLTVRPVPPAAA